MPQMLSIELNLCQLNPVFKCLLWHEWMLCNSSVHKQTLPEHSH